MSLHSPKTLYELSLDLFSKYLNEWSEPPRNDPKVQNGSRGSASDDQPRQPQPLMSVENHHQPINLIFSSLNARPPQWMLSSRPSSTDNLATSNFDDKISSFKKSCHNLVSTFFGRKSLESLEEESIDKELLPAFYLRFRIPENICQDIIKHYQCSYKLSDHALMFPLFDGDVNTITSFQIEDATNITAEGLKALKKHNLIRIKMARLTHCTITELINNLSPWSIWNLESFSVPHCSLTRFNKICIILSLTRLTNLIHLDVSHTSFNNQCLEIITDHLTNLRSLDLTSTKITILKPLAKLEQLTKLNLHNVALTCKDESILGDLEHLECLDISDERFSEFINDDQLNVYFKKFFQMKSLKELDISGRHVSADLVCSLVKHRVEKHKESPDFKPLRFLGLLMGDFTFTQMFDLDTRTKGTLRMTGTGKLIHVIISLIHYKQRPIFIQRALLSLSQYTFSDLNFDELAPAPLPEQVDLATLQNYQQNNNNGENDDHIYDYDDQVDQSEILAEESRLRPDEIQPYRTALVEIVVDIMETHMSNTNLIFISSGNLYNLTKNNPYIHPFILKSVVRVCIRTMQHYSTEVSIIKNVLLTLCSDRILQDISFDHYTCIRLVMETLCTFRDLSVNRLALGICATLAARIPFIEDALAGSHSVYLKRLLDLVQESNTVHTQNNELILKLSLSVLWNFTDEAPKTCEAFIKHNGIKLYVDTLVIFAGKVNIETKILGLLNNIAEVHYLREHLIDSRLLSQLRRLIHSDQINVSYFSVGILAQLASDTNLDWSKVDDFNLDNVLRQMHNQILFWVNPAFEMVAYRSFEPLIPLLTSKIHPSIVLWALYAIHHVGTKIPYKYCRMLHKEKSIETIMNILKMRLLQKYGIASHEQRKLLARRLIDLVTVADDEYQILSKAITDWNCYEVHEWSILVERRKTPLSLSSNDSNNNDININYECKMVDDDDNEVFNENDLSDDKYAGPRLIKRDNGQDDDDDTDDSDSDDDEFYQDANDLVDNSRQQDDNGKQDDSNQINNDNGDYGDEPYDEVDAPKPTENNKKNTNKKHAEEKYNHYLKLENCDCFLKLYLDHDPFLRLPSIIMKAYHCFSPIPLDWNHI